MRKALRIISMSAGIISVVSAVILGCIYLEDLVTQIQKVRTKLVGRANERKYTPEEFIAE